MLKGVGPIVEAEIRKIVDEYIKKSMIIEEYNV
jgi:hypothetical protein